MKLTVKAVSFIVAICFSGTLLAQFPSITSANQIGSIGDTIQYTNANTFGFDPDGSGGAIDVIWNFSGLSPTGTVDFWFEDPALTPEAANFPTATLAMATSGAVIRTRLKERVTRQHHTVYTTINRGTVTNFLLTLVHHGAQPTRVRWIHC